MHGYKIDVICVFIQTSGGIRKMNEKLSRVKEVMKRVWDKVLVFLKLVLACIVKAYRFIAPKAVSGAKFVYEKACVFFKTVVKDKQKLILAIILAVAILFSAIAVVRAVKGVVNGIAGIFTSDKADEESETKCEEAVAASNCEHCVNGVCIHCKDGFIDCPDCENGVCAKCEGTGENGSKMMSLLLDNCTVCKGTGKCDECNENYMIDCKYCEGGKCSECAE